MEMKEIDKLWEYWKIQEKIDKLTNKRNQKMAEIEKLNEAINELKDEQRKYE